MKRNFYLVLMCSACLLPSAVASQVLSSQSRVAPMAPATIKKDIELYSDKLNPDKPTWISISVLAVSKEDQPQGAIVLHAFPDNLPVRGMGPRVVIDAAKSAALPPDGAFGALLDEKMQGLPIET